MIANVVAVTAGRVDGLSGMVASAIGWLFAPSTPPDRLVPPLLRLAAGAILVGFGQSKFTRHAAEAGAFDRYGLPEPDAFAYAIGVVEVGCGALLVLGLMTRLAALVLAGDMVGAVATGGRVDGGLVHLGLAPALFVAMLVVLWLGPGRWSLDEVLWRGTLLRARSSP